MVRVNSAVNGALASSRATQNGQRFLSSLYTPRGSPTPTVVQHVRSLRLRTVSTVVHLSWCAHQPANITMATTDQQWCRHCHWKSSSCRLSTTTSSTVSAVHPPQPSRNAKRFNSTRVYNIRSAANKLDDLLDIRHDLDIDVLSLVETGYDFSCSVTFTGCEYHNGLSSSWLCWSCIASTVLCHTSHVNCTMWMTWTLDGNFVLLQHSSWTFLHRVASLWVNAPSESLQLPYGMVCRLMSLHRHRSMSSNNG